MACKLSNQNLYFGDFIQKTWTLGIPIDLGLEWLFGGHEQVDEMVKEGDLQTEEKTGR